MTTAPRISIIVPTYNRLRPLQRCTAALRRQDLQAPYEIVIADVRLLEKSGGKREVRKGTVVR